MMILPLDDGVRPVRDVGPPAPPRKRRRDGTGPFPGPDRPLNGMTAQQLKLCRNASATTMPVHHPGELSRRLGEARGAQLA